MRWVGKAAAEGANNVVMKARGVKIHKGRDQRLIAFDSSMSTQGEEKTSVSRHSWI